MKCSMVRAGFLSGLFVLAAGLGARAQSSSSVWNGAGTNNNWSFASNWVALAVPPNPSTNLVALAGTARLTPNVDAPWSVWGLVISNNAGGFTLGGSNLTLTANASIVGTDVFDHFGASNVVVNNGIILPLTAANARRTFAINGAGGATFNGAITNTGVGVGDLWLRGSGAGVGTLNGNISIGTNRFFKTDAGTWVIGGAGNVWGVTEMDQTGTVRIAAADALPTNSLVQFDTASPRLDLNGFNQTIASLSGTGVVRTGTSAGGQLTMASDGRTDTFFGSIVENGSVVKRGTTRLVFAGNGSSFTGNLTVAGGTLVASAANSVVAPTGTALGAVTGASGRVISVMTNAALHFAANDVLGNGGSSPTPVLNIVGGIVTITNNFATLGPIVLNGGTLSGFGGVGAANQQYSFAGSITVTGATPSTIVSSGTGTNGDHLGANTAVNVADVTGDANPDLTVSAPLINQNGTLGGGAGGFTKNGAGTMRLDANNTFGGIARISAGILQLSTNGSVSNATVNVGAGAVFDVSSFGTNLLASSEVLEGGGVVTGAIAAANGAKIFPGLPGAAGTLTFQNDLYLNSGVTNAFDLSSDVNAVGGGTNDLLVVSGNFEPQLARVVINPLAPLASGTYRLVNYAASKTTAFNTNVLGKTTRDTWTLDESVTNQISLTVGAGTNQFLIWNPVVSTNWDLSVSTNWINATTALPDLFFNLDYVLFNDSGAFSNTVALATALIPSAVTVNSASNYSFMGAGKISSGIGVAATLTKDGAGTLTLLTTNDYSGVTTVSNGTLQVGNGGASGAIGTGNVAVVGSGILAYFRNDAAGIFNNNASGNGTMLFRGPGAANQGSFIIGGIYTGFTGVMIATNARISIANSNVLGSASLVNVQNSGQIYLTAGSTFGQPLQLAGIGWTEAAGNLGAIRFQGNAQWNGPITLAGNARLGAHGGNGIIAGPIGGSYEAEFWSGLGNTLTIGPSSPSTYGSTRISSNVIVIATNASAFSTGPLVMNGGTFRLNGSSFSFSNLSSTAAGGQIQNAGTNAATMTVGIGDSDSAYGAALLSSATQPLLTTPPLNLAKIGAGALTISQGGANGTNTVSFGTLIISNGTWSGPLSIAAGATAIAVGGPGLVGEYYSITATQANLNTIGAFNKDLAQYTPVMLFKSTVAVSNSFDFGTVGASFPPGFNAGAPVFQGRWMGKFDAGTNAGTYQFTTASDDGSMLYLDGAVVVSNNFAQAVTERTGTVSLATGTHDITIAYNNTSGAYGFYIQVISPGGTKTRLTNGLLRSGAGIGSLSGPAGSSLVVSNGMLYVGQSQNGVFSGNISGNGGLLKAGPAMLTLNGNNSYTDSTTIIGGTLLASNGIPNAASVAVNYGTFSCTGIVAGSVTAQDGGVIAPTLSGMPGTLSIGGTLTMTAGTTNAFNFSATTNDIIATLGSMTISNSIVAINPQAPISNGTYTIATYGSRTGSYWPFVANLNPSASLNNLSLDYSMSNQIRIVFASRSSPIRWNGTSNSTWDVNSTPNWYNGGLATNDVFYNTDAVLLDDTPGVTQVVGIASGLSVAPSSITVNTSTNAFTIQIAGAITGGCYLVKNGTNSLTLSDTTAAAGVNQNFSTGGVTINAGKVILLGQNDGGRSAGFGPVTVNVGGVLQLDSNNTLGQASSSNLTPVIVNGGDLRPNTFDHINSLSLQSNAVVELYTSGGGDGLDWYGFGGTNAVLNVFSSSATITNAAKMTFSHSGIDTYLNVVDSLSPIDAEFSGPLISASGGRYLIMTNSGTLLLSGASDNANFQMIVNTGTVILGKTSAAAIHALGGGSDGLVLNGGTVKFVGSGGDQIAPTARVRINGGVFDLNGTNEAYDALNGTGGTILNSASGTASTNSVGQSNGSGTNSIFIQDGAGQLSFVKLGTGIQVLAGTNAYTGGTAINGGILSVGAIADSGASGIGNSGLLSFNGGTLQYTGAGAAGSGRSVTNAGASTYDITNTAAVLTLAGPVSGPGALTKTGGGTLTLAGLNTIAGAITISNGTVNFSDTSSNSITQISIGTGPASTAVNQTNGFVSSSGVVGGLLIGNLTAGNIGQYSLHGGTLQALATGNRGIILGVNTGTTGLFYMVGGVVTGNQLQVSRSENSGANSAGGYFYQSGGNSMFSSLGIAGATGAAVNNANNYGLLSISGGSFSSAGWVGFAGGNNSTGQIYLGMGGALTLPAFPTVRGTAAYADITFDGGQLIPAAASAAYMGGLSHAYLTANGAFFNVPSSGDITVAQALENAPSQTGTLTKLGTGTLSLSGINIYGGATAVNGGTLLVNGTNSGIGAYAVASNATLWGTGVISTASATIATGGWLGARSTALTGKLTVAAVTFNAGSRFSALLRGTNPTIQVAGNIGSSPSISVQLLALAPGTSVGTNVLMGYGGSFTGNISDFSLISVPNGGQGYLVQDVANSSIDLVVTNAGTGIKWDGGESGNWQAGGPLNWKSMLTGNISQFSPFDTVLFDDTASGTYTVNVAEVVLPGLLVVSNATRDYIFAGSGIGGAVSLTKLGAARLTMSGANSYTGQTVVSAGILSINSDSSLGTPPAAAVANQLRLFGGTTLEILGSAALSANRGVQIGPANGSGSVTVNVATGVFATEAAIIANATGATGGLSKAGSGTLTLSGASTFSGNVAVNAGTLALSSGLNRLNTNIALSVVGGATFDLGGQNQALTGLTGQGVVTSSASTLTITLANGVSNQFAGSLSGGLALTKGGATNSGLGQLVLSGSNSFSGAVSINAGPLLINNSYALGVGPKTVALTAGSAGFCTLSLDGSAGNITLASNITYTTSNQNGGTITNFAGDNVINGNFNLTSGGGSTVINVAGGTLTLDGNVVSTVSGRGFWLGGAGTGTVNGVISATGAGEVNVQKNDGGLWILAGNNTYTNGTSINAGTLQVGKGGVTGTLGTNTVTDNASLVFNRSDVFTNTMRITGTGSVAQSGLGTLVFNVNEGYAGPTLVNSGVLLVNGSISTGLVTVSTGAALVVNGSIGGAVTISASASLGGVGIVSGAVTSAGNVSPGNSSVGLLTVASYTQTAGGTLNIEIGGSNGVAGTDYDQLNVTGAATLGGTLSVTFTNGYTASASNTFLIVNAGGGGGTFAATNLPALTAGNTWAVQYFGGVVILSINPPPAPAGYDAYALQITNGLAGIRDDADGDGYPNLLEYVTGGNPTNADNIARMNAARAGGALALVFTRDTNTVDASLFVEAAYGATNNAAWTGIATNTGGIWSGPAAVTETGGPNPVNVTVTDTDPASTNRFLRLRVTRP